MKIKELFSLEKTIAKEYLEKFDYPWQALKGISEYIISLGERLSEDDYDKIGENVWAAKDAKIYDSAYINGPCIIDSGAEIRHCAFIRGSAIIGKNAVVGNSTELKNVILFDGVQVPHFNYVGDSILGYKAHMGAGSITSNLKSDKSLVVIKNGLELIETNIKKVGAFLGDNVEVGCNSVLNPGVIIGKESTVYPLSNVRGVVPSGCIYKTGGIICKKEIRA